MRQAGFETWLQNALPFPDKLFYAVCQVTHWHCISSIHSLFWVLQSPRFEVAQTSASCLSFFLDLGPDDLGGLNI